MSRSRTSSLPPVTTIVVGPCPDESAFLHVAAGTCAPEARDDLIEHVADCEDCASLLVELVSAEGVADCESRGESLDREGRYRICGILGTGGMGIVYRAHDSRLERNVALKVLRHESGSEETLLREARVMARLAHPNVVRVFDCGVFGGRVFVAMELVHGGTLRSWLASTPRSVSEVLGAFDQAAKGLAAAHRAGIVHRDLKPENLLVEDGRVLVTDFGLARTNVPPPNGSESERLALSRRASSIAGTPSYMAPEQFRGESLDARADVFSFCVTMWEALFGRKPFLNEGVSRHLAKIVEGPAIAAEADVPEHVVRALRKGLAYDRNERHATIDALMAECLSTPMSTTVRRRALLVSCWVSCCVVGLVLAFLRPAPHSPSAHSRVATGSRHAEIEAALPEDLMDRQRARSDEIDSKEAALRPPTSKARPLQSLPVLHGFGALAEPFGEDTPRVLASARGGIERCASAACVAADGKSTEIGDTHCRFLVAADGSLSRLRCQTYVEPRLHPGQHGRLGDDRR